MWPLSMRFDRKLFPRTKRPAEGERESVRQEIKSLLPCRKG